MPRGSGTPSSSSGYNSQGNHYNTPGGSNSSSGSSYHCKPALIHSNTILSVLFAFESETHSHFVIALQSLTHPQTRTQMDLTIIRMTMDPRTITLEPDSRLTLLQADRRRSRLARSKPLWEMNSFPVGHVGEG